MKKYFIFNKDIILVSGKERGIIHNLNNGKVFSIDKVSKEYLLEIIAGKTITEVIGENVEFIDYLNLLVEKNIGYFSDLYVSSGVINYEKNVDKSLKTVWFELRRACNLNCCHCYLDCNNNSDNNLNLLSLEDWKRVVDNLVHYYPPKIILIGGEPLLYKKIDKLISYCREKLINSEIVLYSNLTTLLEKNIDTIINNKVKVVTSVYSYNFKTHDIITRTKGSFIKTINNIKRLINNGVNVQANMVVMKHNIHEVEKTISFINELTGKKGKIDYIRNVGINKT